MKNRAVFGASDGDGPLDPSPKGAVAGEFPHRWSTLGPDRPIRLTQGRGEYLADLRPAGMLEVAFVRSPFAHARVGTITGAGVTAADLDLNDLPVEGGGHSGRSWPGLARDRARFVGETVAAVWAEDRYLAEDLADQVSVEWEPLDLEPPEVIFEHELAAGPVDETIAAAARFTVSLVHWKSLTTSQIPSSVTS